MRFIPFKIQNTKNTIDQKRIFVMFLQKNALIFLKQVIFDRKVFRLQNYDSITLHLGFFLNVNGAMKNTTNTNSN